MGRRPYCPSRMEVSYCTFGFGAICAHYRCRVIHCAITYMRAWVESTQEGNLRLTKLFGGLSYEKIRRYMNHLHTWRQDGRHNRILNFLDPTLRMDEMSLRIMLGRTETRTLLSVRRKYIRDYKKRRGRSAGCACRDALFVGKVIRQNPPLPGLPVHALPVLNHDRTDHNTKLMEHWYIATVAWTSCYCMT